MSKTSTTSDFYLPLPAPNKLHTASRCYLTRSQRLQNLLAERMATSKVHMFHSTSKSIWNLCPLCVYRSTFLLQSSSTTWYSKRAAPALHGLIHRNVGQDFMVPMALDLTKPAWTLNDGQNMWKPTPQKTKKTRNPFFHVSWTNEEQNRC